MTHLGGSQGSTQEDKNRHLVSRGLPGPIARSKEVVSDYLLLRANLLIQVLLGS